MAGALVQTNRVASLVSTCAYSSNVVANNLLVAVCYHSPFSGGGAITGITDTRGSTWAQAGNVAYNTTSQMKCDIWYAVSAGSGANTITVAGPSNCWCIAVFEFSGNATASVLDVAFDAIADSTADPTGTFTTTTANTIVVIGEVGSFSDATAVTSGYTLRVTPKNTFSQADAYNPDVGAAGSKTATFTAGLANNWAYKAAAFKVTATAVTRGYAFIGSVNCHGR